MLRYFVHLHVSELSMQRRFVFFKGQWPSTTRTVRWPSTRTVRCVAHFSIFGDLLDGALLIRFGHEEVCHGGVPPLPWLQAGQVCFVGQVQGHFGKQKNECWSTSSFTDDSLLMALVVKMCMVQLLPLLLMVANHQHIFNLSKIIYTYGWDDSLYEGQAPYKFITNHLLGVRLLILFVCFRVPAYHISRYFKL